MAITRSMEIRRRIGHPVIDADGHMLEFEPAFLDCLRDVGGAEIVERCRKVTTAALSRWYELSPEARRDGRVIRPPWGLHTKNTLDVATAMLPKLFHERLPELGIDFAIVYPTLGMVYARQDDDELRQVVCRAINTYYAETFRGLGDRLTPTALIPTRTPAEAIAELEHVVNVLHLKTIVIDCAVPRPIASFARQFPDAPPEVARRMVWLDSYGVDSTTSACSRRRRLVPPRHRGAAVARASRRASRCEADDPATSWAFNRKTNPFGTRIKAFLGSDIGHWDVPDMTKVVEEAYELVEHGLISDEDFRDFVFVNPVALHGGMNPRFFVGTAVEKEAAALLSTRAKAEQ